MGLLSLHGVPGGYLFGYVQVSGQGVYEDLDDLMEGGEKVRSLR